MKRFAINDLEKWKCSPRRKPLIIEGARQVGKTWLVKEFAATHYKNMVYVNFEQQIYLRDLFKTDFDTDRILTSLKAATHEDIIPGETLIFMDEIQDAENGLISLKYFCENAPEQHVVAAGSLLGIELHRNSSFPVGKVRFMTLRPMSFWEFLIAIGEENLEKLLEAGDWNGINIFAPKLKELLKMYYFVGGMPEAVLAFSLRRDFDEVREIQEEILHSYDFDFSKHAPSEIVPRIRQLWNSLPAQLSKENRKFIYGLVREGARAREYETALQWLIDSGLIYKICNVSAPRIPLKSYEEESIFKLFSLDVGLLGAMSSLDSETIVKGNSIFTEFKGALTEQYTLQELILHNELYYFAKANSQLEIDFLIQANGNVIPIEVKAEENLRARSLRQFVADNSSPEAYRFSMSDYRKEAWMTNLPLYSIESLPSFPSNSATPLPRLPH
ncbi:MAG: ATP-binding protein [Muribaculaceae bacterium]|nr:ATP-binding protein [Muribaculaceae bacterium]